MVIKITNNQSHDDNNKFKENLKIELDLLEKKKLHSFGMKIGAIAVSYFGAYFGGLIVYIGLLEILNYLGFLHFTLVTDIAFFLIAFGVLVILVSKFVSKVMRIHKSYHENLYNSCREGECK
jgi:hypothetical protein